MAHQPVVLDQVVRALIADQRDTEQRGGRECKSGRDFSPKGPVVQHRSALLGEAGGRCEQRHAVNDGQKSAIGTHRAANVAALLGPREVIVGHAQVGVEARERHAHQLDSTQEQEPARRWLARMAEQRRQIVNRHQRSPQPDDAQRGGAAAGKGNDLAVGVEAGDLGESDGVGLAGDADGEKVLRLQQLGRRVTKRVVEGLAQRSRRLIKAHFSPR